MEKLEKLLNRSDYAKCVQLLIEKAEEVAQKIAQKLENLNEPGYDNFVLDSVYSRNVSSSETFLCYKDANGDVYSLRNIGGDYFYANDFNCLVKGATVDMALEFLDRVPEIVEELDKIESEKVAKINQILEKIKI